MGIFGKTNRVHEPDEIPNKQLLALSWNIATAPALYWELAQNPYHPHALEIISEKFPNERTVDVIKAVVLAEPERHHDRMFMLLSKNQQEEELSKQREKTNEIHNRLIDYRKNHLKKLRLLPRNVVYDNLLIAAFETANAKEIENNYSQNQRRDFKLAIVLFIESHVHSSSHSATDTKQNKRGILINAGLLTLSFILFFCLLVSLYPKKEQAEIKKIQHIPQAQSQGFPLRLKIPQISVDATIESVGVTEQGAMAVPNDTVNVGWFDLGPRPGEKGSAVIAGHFDSADGDAGVFANLDKLKEGDMLYVDYRLGITIPFVVRKIQTYNPGYAEDVFSQNDHAHLNLITCDGVWNGKKKGYSKRLVVFTDMAR